MNEEERKIEQKFLPWRFWFSAALTAFLVVTFVYYLPLRFQHAGVEPREGMHGGDMTMEMMDEHRGAAQHHEEMEVLGEGLAVNLNVTPVPVSIGTTARLDFFVNQKPGNIPVTDLEIEHTKLMHVIGVRSDLSEFFHIHPQLVDGGILSVDHIFGKPGLYKMWSEIKKDGINHTFGHPEFAVEGTGAQSEKLVSFGRNVIVGDYQMALRLGEAVVAKRELEFLFDVHTLDSFETELEDYLGEKIHLAIIKDDWKQFLHIHPSGVADHHGALRLIPEARANGGGHDTSEGGHGVEFHVVLPEPGLYRVFAQFRPRGIDLPPDEALTAAFWVRVTERSSPFRSQGLLVLVSIVGIIVLSIGVKRYLHAAHNE